MTTITVGGVTFNNTGAPDASGVTWTFSGTKGWFDGAPAKGGTTDRTQQHGVLAERTWRDARLITVEGHVNAPARRLASDAQRVLASLLAEGTFGDFTVNDPDQGVLTSSVRGEGVPQIDWDSGLDIDFLLTFMAPDPLRYAAPVTLTTGYPAPAGGLEYDLYTDGAGVDLGFLEYGAPSPTGRLVLVNPGTADVSPVFKVTGPVVGGFELIRTGTGDRLRYVGDIPAGSTVTLDSADATVLMDALYDRAGNLTIRDWWAIGAESSVEVTFVPTGPLTAASLAVTFAPGYW